MNSSSSLTPATRDLLKWAAIGSAIAGVTILIQSSEKDSQFQMSSALVLAVSLWLMHKAAGAFDFRRLTIPAFWYLTYIPIIYIPSFIVYDEMQPGDGRESFLFSVQSVMLTIPLGIILVNTLFGFRRSEVTSYFEAPPQLDRDGSSMFLPCLIGSGIAIALMTLYLMEVGEIPLFLLLRDPSDYDALAWSREEALKLLDSPFKYSYYVLRILGFPFLAMVGLGTFLLTRNRRWLLFFLAVFSIGLLFASFTTEKAPAATVVLLMFLFYYLYQGGKLNKKVLIAVPILALLIPGLIYVGLAYENEDADVLGYLGNRLFYDPAHSVSLYFELFPKEMDYLYGRSIGKLAWLMGWEYFDTSNFVGIRGDGARMETVSANAAFFGDLNANFGIPGVILGGLAAGMIMQFIQVHLTRRPKTILNLAAYTHCLFTFWFLHFTTLFVVLASNGVLLALFLPWIFKRLAAAERTSSRPAGPSAKGSSISQTRPPLTEDS